MRGQPVVQDGAAHAARGLGLAEGPVHGVQQAQRFHRAVAQVAAVALERHGAADVHVPQIHGRVAVQHPVGQHLACATGGLNANRIEPGGDKQVAHLGRFAQQVAVVGREALGAVEKQVDAGFLQRGRAVHGRSQQRLDVLQVIGQRVEAEGFGNALHAPGLGYGFKPPH